MTKAELFKLLENIPDEADIVVRGTEDEILGEYTFSPDITVTKDYAYGKGYQKSYSTYVRIDDERKEVWVLE